MSLQKPIFKNVRNLIYNSYEKLEALCSNPNGVRIAEQLVYLLSDECWIELCGNPYAVHLIENNLERINKIKNNKNNFYRSEINAWCKICSNHNAIHIIKNNLDKIDIMISERCILSCLASNKNPKIIPIIERYFKYMDDDDIEALCINPIMIEFIKKNVFNNPNEFNINFYEALCSNTSPEAIPIIEEYFYSFIKYEEPKSQFIDRSPIMSTWGHIFSNPNAIHIIKNNMHVIDKYYLWENLCSNPNAIEIIEENIEKILRLRYSVVRSLMSNPCAIHIIEKYSQNINYYFNICINPNATHLVEKYINSIDKYTINNILCIQPHLIDLINKYYDKIDPYNNSLCYNPEAIHLVANYDYHKMKELMIDFNNELCQYVFHPKRIEKIMTRYGISHEDFDKYFYKL